jgi:hypothetical protein
MNQPISGLPPEPTELEPLCLRLDQSADQHRPGRNESSVQSYSGTEAEALCVILGICPLVELRGFGCCKFYYSGFSNRDKTAVNY